jgi:hypothetical protein
MAQAATQAVEPPDHEGIASAQVIQAVLELRALADRARPDVAEDARAAGLLERVELQRGVLLTGERGRSRSHGRRPAGRHHLRSPARLPYDRSGAPASLPALDDEDQDHQRREHQCERVLRHASLLHSRRRLVGGRHGRHRWRRPSSSSSCGEAWPVIVRLPADGSAFFARLFSTVLPGAPWTVGAGECAPGAVCSVVPASETAPTVPRRLVPPATSDVPKPCAGTSRTLVENGSARGSRRPWRPPRGAAPESASGGPPGGRSLRPRLDRRNSPRGGCWGS